MNLLHTIKTKIVNSKNISIDYIKYEEIDIKDSLKLKIVKSDFKLEVSSITANAQLEQLRVLKEIGISDNLIKKTLHNEYESELNKRIYTKFKELGSLTSLINTNKNKNKNNFNNFLFKVFKYEKIKTYFINNNSFIKYLYLIKNLLMSINRCKSPDFIIVSKDIFSEIMKDEKNMLLKNNEILEKTFLIDYVGKYLDFDIFVNFDSNISNEIIFGCNTNKDSDISTPSVIYVKKDNIDSIVESMNTDLKSKNISLIVNDNICIMDNAEKLYYTDKISLNKKYNFWIYIWQKIKNKLK